ncbi:hypothetical protein [Limobrevibacterium gyesilva]|uniref:Uncharacterized protein n=1 Tax=Limobrevibacterium gyesilva TaxID=2991712 RepID=A0AA41YNK8_9PROT|nr:hypothetical protein [Limobrevibacterium gyesilva]MCW3475826.1 hypothetical protein [Limobrevibacterium gyesilva]
MFRLRLALPLIALSVLTLGGCSIGESMVDPYKRPGTWRPMGANALNLELQVARPADLVQGRGTVEADGDSAAKAIERLRNDKVKPLPQSSISSVGSSGGSSGGGS